MFNFTKIILLFLYLLINFSCINKIQIESKKIELEQKKSLDLLIQEGAIFNKLIPDSFKLIASQLEEVLINDQKFRSVKYPQFLNLHLKEQELLDSQNIIIVYPILKKYGFLSTKEVGIGSLALIMIIQHSQIEKQLEFRQLIKNGYENGKLPGAYYAMFEDRILKKENKKQLYGTQMKNENGRNIIWPIESIDSLEFRREKLKIHQSYYSYCKTLNVKWDLQNYKDSMNYWCTKFKIIN